MRFVYVAFALTLLALPACKQGEGERCQVDSDCQSGLVCAPSTRTCEHGIDEPHEPSPDALPIDASIDGGIDAMPIDAMPDAMIDALL